MASNLIVNRVANFFKENPPFSFLDPEEIRSIAERTTIQYFERDQDVFKEGEKGKNRCFVLKQGSVDLLVGKGERVDTCDTGDLFGVRSILSGKPYVMTARSTSESLVYVIPAQTLKDIIARNSQVASFFTSGLASGQAVLRGDKRSSSKTSSVVLSDTQYLSALRSGNEVLTKKEVLHCLPDTSIQVAAQLMSTWKVGSIIVSDVAEKPLGIVTDTDLRNKVVAKGLSVEKPISMIMSSPVASISPNMSLMELILKMIELKYHHIIVTEDGTDQSGVVGIVSDHDIMLNQANHPAALLKGVKSTSDLGKLASIRDKAEGLLKEYLDHDIDVKLITEFISAINDQLLVKAIENAKEELSKKFEPLENIQFTWINFGSEGRKEQLLRTDLDNAIVFEDGSQNEKNQEVLLSLASRVIEILNSFGFQNCPAQMMANNPKWCQPISQWKRYFSGWIKSPGSKEVMNTTIFLDYRHIYGNQNLVEVLDEHIGSLLNKNPIYLNHLAHNAISNPPPIGFFNNLMVEKSGEHRDSFDIKARAMMPLIDAARVLCLHYGVLDKKSTIDRYKSLITKEPKNKELFEEAIMAFEIFLKLRARNGLKAHDSGRYIKVGWLNKLEKKILRNAFLPIADLQKLMEVRFQLAYFN